MSLYTLSSCLKKIKLFEDAGELSSLTANTDDERDKQPVYISRPYKLPDFLTPDNVRIPAFALYQGGFGFSNEKCMIYYARGLAAGYRHMVTQFHSEKEGVIAHVLKSAHIPRERVFITSIIKFSKKTIHETVAAIRKAAFKLSELWPIDLMLADPIKGSDEEGSDEDSVICRQRL
jgi:hypothetical protein